jgi:AcrR family transcriptional regulator
VHSTYDSASLAFVAKAGPRRAPEGADDVKDRLIDATIRVLARDGFAHTSARAIASEAGGVNGLIFYHFGSMELLLAATARALTERGLQRVRTGLGGDSASATWSTNLGAVIRREAASDDGRAVMELLVGSRTSGVLADEVRSAIDSALAFAVSEIQLLLGASPITQIIPAELIAELAAAAFLGLEILTQNGREVDIDRLASTVAAGLTMVAGMSKPN